MKLDIDFSLLDTARKSIGGQKAQIDLGRQLPRPSFTKTISGVDLDDIIFNGGGIVYKDQQVLIYIESPYEDEESLFQKSKTRFHFSDCKTIETMKSIKRFERYVVTNETNGAFLVFPYNWETKTQKKEKIICKLYPCKNCLKQINYQDYNSVHGSLKSDIFENFSIKDFFDEFSAIFRDLPTSIMSSHGQEYPSNWASLSSSVRRLKKWACDCCQAKFDDNKKFLHVHHINGIRSDCSSKNLRCLCLLCHSKQPKHGHMRADQVEENEIKTIRTNQGLPKNCSNCA